MRAREPNQDFGEATAAFRAELRVHCYRMLGSAHDCDDAVQEVMLRAWRARATLADPRGLRAWLYRISTNVCLDELARRPRRVLSSSLGPPADPSAAVAPPTDEPLWLEPMPGAWLDGLDATAAVAQYTLKESVALAFVAALQTLTPAQRAVLLLRDVVELSAAEAAAALGLSVAATNSALHRARRAIADARPSAGAPASSSAVAGSAADEAVLERFVRAFESSDVGALVAVLREDVTTTMPPSPTWISGLPAHRIFYGEMFARTPPGAMRFRRLACNGDAGFAFYRAASADAPALLRAVDVVTLSGGAVTRIDHFMSPLALRVFALPERLG